LKQLVNETIDLEKQEGVQRQATMDLKEIEDQINDKE